MSEAERQLGSKLVLARNILRLRVQRGMSQVALATAAGISQPRIAEIENARANPQLESLERLAAALNVPMESLFKVRHASRVRRTSVTRSLHLSSRSSAGEGWDRQEVVEEVVAVTSHFGTRRVTGTSLSLSASDTASLSTFSDG